jgi:hypothetical protein
MKGHIKYWAFILLFSYGLTIGMHYLLRPIWFDKNIEHMFIPVMLTPLFRAS